MPVLDDSLLGRMLDEYKVERALGKGGMARVYLALDTRLQRYVALKVIAPNLRADPEYSIRFEREAQSIARLEHPNIVNIYRFGEVDGLYYMAMKFVDGVDLQRIVEDYERDGELMALEDIARVIRDVGSALDYAHSRHVIHRDVKPGNIVLDRDGRAILTDFGLALLRDVGTRGEIFGSPLYIAPEQAISSSNVVPQSDLYSLGVTLFYMLTGTVPFKGDDPLDVALQQVSDTPPPPSHFNPSLSSRIDAIVLRCMEKEPTARYQTGAEFSAALDAAIAASRTTQATTVGALRYSQLHLPAKVQDVRQDLPPLPEASTAPPFATPPQPASQAAQFARADGNALNRNRARQGAASGAAPSSLESLLRRNPAIIGLALAVMVGSIALIAVGSLILAALFNQQRAAAVATSTATLTVEPTALPQVVTVTPLAAQAAAPTNTVVPTPTALVLLNTPLVQATSFTAAPPNSMPSDRSVVPPGSRRLGEFAVEWYCNERGLGVRIINNGIDWACTNNDGSTNFVLAPTDFDTICRSWYRNPNAFAIRDQTKPTPAYNWSCYEPTFSATSAPLLATPSFNSLKLNYTRDWMALTNISTVPLNLVGVELRREGRSLNASAWGRSTLSPGECLVIHKSDEQPEQLPAECAAPISLPADKDEREYWLKGEVLVYVSPQVQYRYNIE